MSTGRASIGGNSAIKDSLKMCSTQVEAAAERSKQNKEGLSPEILNKWNERILSLSKSIAVTRNKSENTIQVLDSIVGTKRNSDQLETDAVMKAQLIEAISKKCSTFDENSDANVMRILNMLKPSNNESDDFEIVGEGFKQTDTMCPYTGTTFKEAMKCSMCPHHMSKIALDTLLNRAVNAEAQCPVAGCRGKWRKNNSSLDEEFQMKVDRFLRIQSIASVPASQFATVIDDEEYTAL